MFCVIYLLVASYAFITMALPHKGGH